MIQRDHRLRRGTGLLLLSLIAGCASEDAGISPPRDEFYFPTGLALTHWIDPTTGTERPDRPLLVVSNSNADLRFNGGTLTVVDLQPLTGDLSALGQQPDLDCRPDPFFPSRWECPEPELIVEDATIRVGDFPNEVRIPATVRGNGERRVFSPVRGTDELTWAELVSLDDGGVDLRCDSRVPSRSGCSELGSGADCPQWDCDDGHRVDRSPTGDIELAAEPFGIAVNMLRSVYQLPDGTRRTCDDGQPDPPACSCPESQECPPGSDRPTDVCCLPGAGEEQIFVAHLDEGQVSLFRSDDEGVELIDQQGGFFQLGGQAVGGAFALAVRTPGDPDSTVYVSSRDDGDLGALVVQGDAGASPQIVQARGAAIGAVRPASGEAYDLRGIAFAAGGGRLYAVSRVPAALVAIDLVERDGVIAHEPVWAVEVCNEPAGVVLGPHDLDPEAQFAYIVCFAEAAVFVVDTRLGSLVGRVVTGRGPNGLALDVGSARACEQDTECSATPAAGGPLGPGGADERCDGGRCVKRFPRLFVSNFLENTVGVVDLRPESPTYRRMVARIGKPTGLVEE